MSIQACSVSGFDLVLPFDLVKCRDWSADTTDGDPAYRSVATVPSSPVSSSVPHAVISAAAQNRATKAATKLPTRERMVARASQPVTAITPAAASTSGR